MRTHGLGGSESTAGGMIAIAMLMLLTSAWSAAADTSKSARTTIVNEIAQLGSSTLASGDYFGSGVAVAGEAISIGAQGDDHGTTDTGAAYVFLRPPGGWADSNRAGPRLSRGPARDHDPPSTHLTVAGRWSANFSMR